MKKSVSIFLLATILFQGCVVYQKVPVSITEAHDKGKVLIIDSLKNKTKAEYIEKVDDNYYIPYRVRKKGEDGEYHWFEGKKQLNSDDIKIYLLDKNKSKTGTIVLVVLSPFIAIGVYVAISLLFFF